MKKIIFYSLLFFCLSANSQDTLYFQSGDYQIVQLVSIEQSAGLIYYKIGDKMTVRAISSLKSYTNHTEIGKSNAIVAEGVSESSSLLAQEPINYSDDQSKYTYNKFSIGINWLSPLSAGNYEFLVISTNYNQSMFVQYNFNDQIGVRLPIRIGFNQLKTEITNQEQGYSRNHSKDLIFETGAELVLMSGDNQKISPYFMPGIYIGRNQGAYRFYNNINNLSTISPTPARTIGRFALNGGIQFNSFKYIQINIEAGINLNNSGIIFYYNSSIPLAVERQIGLQAAINMVYRFGGRLRE